MPQTNYQEPIDQEDVDIAKKFHGGGLEKGIIKKIPEAGGEMPGKEAAVTEKIPTPEKEITKETAAEQTSEKIESARKTIQTQKPMSAALIHDDAQIVAGIQEYEKKVEKLVEIALEKGPEHAIKVAMHMDANDNYTLDELHDKMIVDDLRKQLFSKGLLKEL